MKKFLKDKIGIKLATKVILFPLIFTTFFSSVSVSHVFALVYPPGIQRVELTSQAIQPEDKLIGFTDWTAYDGFVSNGKTVIIGVQGEYEGDKYSPFVSPEVLEADIENPKVSDAQKAQAKLYLDFMKHPQHAIDYFKNKTLKQALIEKYKDENIDYDDDDFEAGAKSIYFRGAMVLHLAAKYVLHKASYEEVNDEFKSKYMNDFISALDGEDIDPEVIEELRKTGFDVLFEGEGEAGLAKELDGSNFFASNLTNEELARVDVYASLEAYLNYADTPVLDSLVIKGDEGLYLDAHLYYGGVRPVYVFSKDEENSNEVQEYPNETHAKTKGTITYLEDHSSITPTDPTDPEKPVDPTDPTNPNGAELMIVYASNFQFGEQEKTETSWQAMADEMKDGSKVTPFVVTKDSRGTDRKGWSLTAELSKEFTDTKDKKLAGAELELSNMFYTDKVTGAPKATNGSVVLNNQAQEVAKADATQGIGSWSLGLGELQADNTTNGVKLSVPLNSAKNTDTYTAEVTWELTADPSK